MAGTNSLNTSLSGQAGTGQHAGSDSPQFTTQIETPKVSSPTAVDLVVSPASGQSLDINIVGGGGYDATITGSGDYVVNLGAGSFILDGSSPIKSFIDDDTMATATATNVSSSESVKAYVDATGGGTAATQADQETGTSITTFVSPGRQQYHTSAAKVWLLVAFSGVTPSISASFNVTSIVKIDTVRVTVNFTVPFSTSSYASIAGSGYIVPSNNSVSNRATGSLRVNSDGDVDFYLAVFGDQ